MAVMTTPQSAPRIISVDPSNGTMTRASILGMTPQMFEDQGFKEVGMDKVYGRAKEARCAGYQEKGIEMLVAGVTGPMKFKGLTKQSLGHNESVILPYIVRKQRTTINANYWRVYAAAAHPSAGVNGIHPGAYRLTIRNTGSTYASALVQIQRYFLTGKFLIVDHSNGSTGAAYQAQFKIVASSNANSGGVEQAYVDVEPSVDAVTWAGYSANAKLPYQPSSGLAMVLANSISDFESWGQNHAADNPMKLLAFWVQTARFAWEYNDEYVRALEAGLTSEYFKQFRQLPLAEQRRQQYAHHKREMLNTFFYGQKINDYQTVENYQQLPRVLDPENPDLLLEYKANTEGVISQLRNSSRVTDHLGNAFNLAALVSTCYQIKRAREGAGMSDVSEIDVMVPRELSGLILANMVTFYKAKYGVDVQRQYNPNQELRHDNQVALRWNTYQIPDDFGGFNLNVFADDFFSDRIAAAGSISTAAVARARSAWVIDWTDVALEMGASTSVSRQTNVNDALFRYVIKPNMKHVQLESETFAVTVSDPNRSAVVENFSNSINGLY